MKGKEKEKKREEKRKKKDSKRKKKGKKGKESIAYKRLGLAVTDFFKACFSTQCSKYEGHFNKIYTT